MDIFYKVMKSLSLLIIMGAMSSCASTNSSLITKENDAKANRLKPRDKEIAAGFNLQLGLGYLREGNMQRAKSKLLKAQRQMPDWPPMLDAMAYYLEKTGDLNEAKKYYQRSLEIAPKDGKVLNNHGAYLCRQKQYKEADAYFIAATKDPAFLANAEAYENAGLCALASPNNKKAASGYLKKALLEDPKRTVVIFELAQVAFQQQQYSEAKTYLDKYLISAQGNAAVFALAYQIAVKLGNKTAATNYAALLKNNYPTSTEAKQLLPWTINKK